MKHLFTILLILIFSQLGSAQCPTFFNPTTQSELNRFIRDYPNCTRLRGITIDGQNNTGNDAIRDLSPLQNINTIERSIFIRNCPRLRNLRGLTNLVRVGRSIDINTCHGLTSTDGAPNLKIISTLRIYRNYNLSIVSGFHSLESLENLQFFENYYIESFRGLRNVRKLGRLTIKDCKLLRSLEDFQDLKVIARILELSRNYSLTECSIQALCDYINDTRLPNFWIYDNGANCNTAAEIDSRCNSQGLRRIEDVDNDILGRLSLFPNPATDQLSLNFGNGVIVDEADLTIHDVQGRVVKSQKLSRVFMRTNIDISEIPNGMYVLTINSNYRTVSKKLMVQH